MGSDPPDLDVRALLAGLSLPERFVVARSPASRTPVETGYLECMRLVAAKDGITAEAAITGFVGEQVERYPDLERHLVELYGTLGSERADDPRFRSIDYPGFDLGPIALGIGLFADHVPYRSSAIWCWSRVVNWHK